ncbi:MAG TPA: hypothetical protein DCG48_07740 [Rhodospirillaceae bacterium]|nr:hypothetical protein [Rhodospirillaceae bacterium]|tara:strand:- start:5005 stop:5916 length:912 start_codon:yes stop_codon:yes gene_type:complete
MLMNLSPADLDAFVSVAESGSFRQAARDLGVSQPTISARIRHLETVLGVSLFHRTTRRVVITEAGERLRGRVERMILETRALVREFREEAHLSRGRVVVGASPSAAAAFLPGVLGEFQRRHPEIEVVLLDDFFGQVMDRVIRGDVDMAVSPFDGDETPFVVEPLLTDTVMLAVREDHPLAARDFVTLTEIGAERLISMPPESAAWAYTRRAFEGAGVDYAPVLMTRYALTLVNLVKEGVGVGLVAGLVARVLDMRGLKLLPVADVDLTRRVSVIQARDRTLTPAAQAFRDLMRRTAKGFSQAA